MTVKTSGYYPEYPEVEANKVQKRIEKLERLLAKEIEKAVALLQENSELKTKLEQAEKQIKAWQQHLRKIKEWPNFKCNRNEAMVVYGDVDISEVVGEKSEN